MWQVCRSTPAVLRMAILGSCGMKSHEEELSESRPNSLVGFKSLEHIGPCGQDHCLSLPHLSPSIRIELHL